MPELPEVETIIRDLRPLLIGKRIIGPEVLHAATINRPVIEFAKSLTDRKICDIIRRGKNIIFKLDEGYLVIHLKMTGQLVFKLGRRTLAGGHPIINVGQVLPNKFTRVILKFNRGNLYFNDVRKFGWLRIMTAEELNDYLTRLGVEPMGPDFTWPYVKKLFVNKRIAIKQALLDQSKIAGLGNIYVDEALWAAGIAPSRPAQTLTEAELKRLQAAIKQVLKLAIKQRGTSFSDYRDGHGEAGKNLKFLKVYGRAGQVCAKCRQPIKKFKLGGRGTHWCDHCQK